MGIDRRSFLTFAAGGVTGLLFTPAVWQSLDDVSIWTQNWSWIPRIPRGEITRTSTTAKLCPTGCGIRVDAAAGVPFRAEGDPANPLSGGAVTALAASEVALHYSPARAKKPMKKAGDKLQEISWDEAMKILAEKAKPLMATKDKAIFVSGDENGTVNEVFSAFLAKLGSDQLCFMPSDAASAMKAWGEVMGGKGLVGYDVENSDFVLAIGADVFDSWGPSVRYAKAYDASHPIGGQASSTWVYAGPRRHRTAAASDKWLPVKPGSEAALALCLAGLVAGKGGAVGFADAADLAGLAKTVDVKAAEAATGLPAAAIQGLAADLAKAKAPVVICGSENNMGAPAAFLAGMALNAALGRFNKPGGVMALPEIPTVVAGAKGREAIFKNSLLAALADGKAPEAIFFYEANPVHALPQIEAAVKKVPFKVSFNAFLDETSKLCDLVLPTALPLERWDDLLTPFGLGFAHYAVCQPMMKPSAELKLDVKPAADVILALAKDLGAGLGFEKFADVVKAKVKAAAGMGGFLAQDAAPWTTRAGKSAPAVKGDLFEALLAGKTWALTAPVTTPNLKTGAKMVAEAKAPAAGDFPLALSVSHYLVTGVSATGVPPHNVACLGESILDVDGLIAEMNAATAAKNGVKNGDKVKLVGPKGEVKVKVKVFEGVMNDVVATTLGLGYGEKSFDEFSQSKGDNAAKALTIMADAPLGPVVSGSRVKIAKI